MREERDATTLIGQVGTRITFIAFIAKALLLDVASKRLFDFPTKFTSRTVRIVGVIRSDGQSEASVYPRSKVA